MSEIVKDVLYIKKIQRVIGRELDEIDLEAIMMGEPLYFQKKTGELVSFIVPLYRLPQDLMNVDMDLAVLEKTRGEANFFEYMIGLNRVDEVDDGI